MRYVASINLALVLLLATCASRQTPSQTSLAGFPEMRAKESLQANSPHLPLLEANRSTGKGADFVLPGGMSYSTTGDLYISDNNGQTIHRWPVGNDQVNIFLAKNAVGKLEFPNTIQWNGNHVFVADNDGLKVFSGEGQFEKLIRTYFTIFSFVVTPRSTILVNALIRKADANDPLIVELDSEGKRIRGFGQRHNEANKNGVDDRAFLTVAKNLLFAAFKYRQSIEVYDIDSGDLVRTIPINDAVLNQLPDLLAHSSVPTDNKNPPSPRYIAGVRAIQDQVFVCLHLPRPEILVFDDEGHLLNQFRVSTTAAAVDIFGFDARASGKNIELAVGVLDPNWSSTVYELTMN